MKHPPETRQQRDERENARYWQEAAHRRHGRVSLTEETRIKLTFAQVAAGSGFLMAAVAAVCTTYFGVIAKLTEVNVTLTEIKLRMERNVDRDELRDWLDDFRAANPQASVPGLRKKD